MAGGGEKANSPTPCPKFMFTVRAHVGTCNKLQEFNYRGRLLGVVGAQGASMTHFRVTWPRGSIKVKDGVSIILWEFGGGGTMTREMLS